MKVNQISLLRQILSSWKVQLGTYNILHQEYAIIQAIAQARQRPPFPAGYQPQRIDILFEDQIHLTRLNGCYVYYKNWKGKGHPKFTEFRFDGECALFSVQGDVLVDRVRQMASRDQEGNSSLLTLKQIA